MLKMLPRECKAKISAFQLVPPRPSLENPVETAMSLRSAQARESQVEIFERKCPEGLPCRPAKDAGQGGLAENVAVTSPSPTFLSGPLKSRRRDVPECVPDRSPDRSNVRVRTHIPFVSTLEAEVP